MTHSNLATHLLNDTDAITATPVLFIPGALTGEWIWQNNFREYFDQQGFSTHAMSFSGPQATFVKRNTIRFEDYLGECVAKIRSLDSPPILVAHSLGGLIAMHAATKTDVHAMVLLSPVPHSGVAGSLTKLGRKSPLSLLKFMTVVVDARIANYAAAPLGIYSETCDEASSLEATRRLRSESLAVMLRLLAPPTLAQSKLDADRILFMAATGDHIIPPDEVEKTANKLGSPFKIYDGLSHTFQVERSWPVLADDMLDWLSALDA